MWQLLCPIKLAPLAKMPGSFLTIKVQVGRKHHLVYSCRKWNFSIRIKATHWAILLSFCFPPLAAWRRMVRWRIRTQAPILGNCHWATDASHWTTVIFIQVEQPVEDQLNSDLWKESITETEPFDFHFHLYRLNLI